MQEESLNIQYHTCRLILKALNQEKRNDKAAEKLGICLRSIYRYKKMFKIKLVGDEYKIVEKKHYQNMKKLLLFLLCQVSLDGFSQCEPNTFVFSLTPGITQSGAFFSMEGGIWPIQGKLGVMAGPLMYDEKIATDKGTEKVTQIDFTGRVIYKVTEVGSDHPQLVTVFATARGMYGGSYRAYWSIGETQLVGIEPVYVNRLGFGVNLLFTSRL